MIKTFGSLIGRTRLLSIVLLTDIPGFPETLSGPNAHTIPSSTSVVSRIILYSVLLCQE
jgi:hypothetical protein